MVLKQLGAKSQPLNGITIIFMRRLSAALIFTAVSRFFSVSVVHRLYKCRSSGSEIEIYLLTDTDSIILLFEYMVAQ